MEQTCTVPRLLDCGASEVMRHATLAVQQHAMVVSALKDTDGNDGADSSDLSHAETCLESAIALKSRLEGSYCPHTAEHKAADNRRLLPHGALPELKEMVRCRTPSTLPATARARIADELVSAMGERGHEVLFAFMDVCPFFSHLWEDPQARGRRGVLCFVYRAATDFFLSHVSSASKAYSENIGIDDDDWLEGKEVRWYLQQMQRGNNRYVRLLFCGSESIVYESEEWKELRTELRRSNLLTRLFVESSLGQVMGLTVGRDKKVVGRSRHVKQKNKKTRAAQKTGGAQALLEREELERACRDEMKLTILKPEARGDVTSFSTSFRLLRDAWCAITGKDLIVWEEWPGAGEHGVEESSNDGSAEERWRIDELELWDYKNYFDDVMLQRIFQLLTANLTKTDTAVDRALYSMIFKMQFVLRRASKMCDIPEKVSEEVVAFGIDWSTRLRTRSFEVEVLPKVRGCGEVVLAGEQELAPLRSLMEKIGAPLAEIDASRVLFLVEGGSRMYGLSMPGSDVDYIAVYAFPTEDVLGTVSWPKESQDNRGHQYEVEHACYEVRMFCEMLLKGNPNVMELLYTDDAVYESPLWKLLKHNRDYLLSESVLMQYLGWVTVHLGLVEKNKYPERAGKLFYHAFHKLHEVRRLLQRQGPKVRVEGETRDFILRIRRGPLEGEFSREALLERGWSEVRDIKQQLLQRKWRYPEAGQWRFLDWWICCVRNAFFSLK